MSGHPDQFFGGRTYSQHGEDLMIANLFWLMGITQPSFLDIGANHPFNISNTALLYSRGSRGVNVDANPEVMNSFAHLRPEDLSLNFGVAPEAGILPFYMIDGTSGRNTFVKAEAEKFVAENEGFKIAEVRQIAVLTLNQLVDRYLNSRFPDLLSIDIEGLDAAVLKGTSFAQSKPKVICAEVKAFDFDLARHLGNSGFFFYCRMGSNEIYINNEHGRKVR